MTNHRKPSSNRRGGTHSSDPSHNDSYPDGLPRSVRGQPQELRAAIRRRQSAESARRRRERDATEMETIEKKVAENQRKMDALERTIDELSAELNDRG